MAVVSARLNPQGDPRRPDLAIPWVKDANKTEEEKDNGNQTGIKELYLFLASGFAMAAVLLSVKMCAWASLLCMCSYFSNATAFSDFKNLAQMASLLILGLYICYVKPGMQRQTVVKEVIALSQALRDAGHTEYLPQGEL